MGCLPRKMTPTKQQGPVRAQRVLTAANRTVWSRGLVILHWALKGLREGEPKGTPLSCPACSQVSCSSHQLIRGIRLSPSGNAVKQLKDLAVLLWVGKSSFSCPGLPHTQHIQQPSAEQEPQLSVNPPVVPINSLNYRPLQN